MSGVPILLVGAGRMGGAFLAGWRAAGLAPMSQVFIRDPAPGGVARDAIAEGAAPDPSSRQVGAARTVVLAMKPQVWREAIAGIADLIAPDAVVISLLAGVDLSALATQFRARSVARVMPTMAIAVGRGPISLVASDAKALARARWLLGRLGEVIELPDESLMDAATAASGSGPGYLYAFVEALAEAGADAGLPRSKAEQLARSTVIGAVRLMEVSGAPLAALRRDIASPGGATEAGLKALDAGGLGALLRAAVATAKARSRELGGR